MCNACHRSDDVAALEASLHAGIDPNTVDTNGATPNAGYKTAPLLFIAAGENHVGTVAALLAAGADVDKAKTSTGATPLFVAVELGHLIQENDPAAGKGNLAFGEAIFSLRSVEAKFTGGIRVVVLSEIREIAGGHFFLIIEMAKNK